MELTEGTKLRAREAEWTDELVQRVVASSLRDRQVRALLALRLNEQRMNAYMDAGDRNEQVFHMKMDWAMPTTQLGMRAKPGPDGLGMQQINIGTYAHVPDYWPYENDTPLGSHPTPGSYMPGPYAVYTKSEVWAEGCDELYDRAVRERWAAATAIDWGALEKQPEEIERAICQICTEFAQHGLTIQKVLASWEERIAYGFHDMKNVVSTQCFDEGRKVEVLRKRALANGGGLGQQSFGTLYRSWFSAPKPTQVLFAIDVVYKCYEVVTFEKLAEICPSPVDRDIFGRLAHDSARHLEFGVRHLQYYVQHHKDAREFLTHYMNRGEASLADELQHSRVDLEALIVLFAGGVERLEVGIAEVRRLREAQLRKYLGILDSVSVDRLPDINPLLLSMAREPAATVA
jgi:hypothetical protein